MAGGDPMIVVNPRYDADAAELLAAAALRECIERRLGPDRILPADPFGPSAKQRLLDPPGIVLVVVGPGWVASLQSATNYSLHFAMGLIGVVRVVPVLVGGAPMPSASELPESLHPLVRLHAAQLDLRTIGDDADRLVAKIVTMLDRTPPGAGRSARASSARSARPRPGRDPDLDAVRPVHSPDRAPVARAPGPGAFLSYRRSVSWATARLVAKDLIAQGIDTFVDVEAIDNGAFEQVILTQIAARPHFVVVLEPGSLDRITQRGDWLRREIAEAIRLERNVVPLLCNGFTFPVDLRLPGDVEALPGFTAVTVPPDYFEDAMRRLRTRFLGITRPVTPAPDTTWERVRRRLAQALIGTLPSA